MVQQVTKGIKISVESGFEETFVRNYTVHFAFFYIIGIENKSKDIVQLLSRHWQISDTLRSMEFVDGEGVVGQKPIINPGESYTYRSGCLLVSPFGEMRGHYRMISHITTNKFRVYVPGFNLYAPFALN